MDTKWAWKGRDSCEQNWIVADLDNLKKQQMLDRKMQASANYPSHAQIVLNLMFLAILKTLKSHYCEE